MMSKGSKQELTTQIHPRYLKASRKEKTRILDEFVASTGYHRKYAIRLLKHGLKRKGYKKVGRRKKYQGEVVKVLEKIWKTCGRICSKRLHPFLPEMVSVMEREGELSCSSETRTLLLSMSRATIDRCLKKARYASPKGISTTRPGKMLKKSIPVRTWHEWDDTKPGFVEIDLVAHCGETAAGQFIYTLTAVDVSTGWTECFAIPNRAQTSVSDAIKALRIRLPFPLLGIDSDNGSEFINNHLFQYCLKEKITFTRSRPYKKNDQAYVEQKNGSVVRNTVGYDRFDTEDDLFLLQRIYKHLHVYVNFFQPVMKLIKKERIDGKTLKVYDQATSPYRRVLASDEIDLVYKIRLTNLYASLNPVQLRKKIDLNVGKLWKIV
jgi:transposase InsO family protein